MKTLYVIAGMLAGASPALADSPTVENALKSRSELSSFYDALVSSGVSHELRPNASYSVFAPTNEAFAKISTVKYPCLREAECSEQLADIVRNHIVPGEVMIGDAAKQKGGIYSIDQRFIAISQPTRNTYGVDGKNITSTSQLAGGVLYKIDGVLANSRELAAFTAPRYVYAPGTAPAR